MTTRTPDAAEYTHERLGDHFATAQSTYDTLRRVEVLVDEFLSDEMIVDRDVIDVGCGLGQFSSRLHRRGGNVLAVDLGPGLVERARASIGCRAEVADALALVEKFGTDRFDLVVSSECIEHTPDPAEALRQMARITRPGGYLSVSTPNVLWWPAVWLATVLKLRPFDGYENFTSWHAMRRILHEEGLEIVEERGVHLFPFQFRMHALSRWCDEKLQLLRPAMINMCVLARKPPSV